MTTPTEAPSATTCQICGRAILAKTGVIAHHGYQRPGGGWQTSSCLGARYAPYEASRDRIPAVIEHVELAAGSAAERLAALRALPATLTYYRRGYGGAPTGPGIEVARPEDLLDVAQLNDQGGPVFYRRSRPNSYEAVLFERLCEAARDRDGALVFAAELRARYEAWVAPAEAGR